MGVTAAVPTSQIHNSDGFELPVTLVNSKRGAFVIAPQLPDGSELLIGKQRMAPELGRWMGKPVERQTMVLGLPP